MIQDPEINSIIGKKRRVPLGFNYTNKRILLSRPSSFGDYFYMSAIINAIKDKFSGTHITYVTRDFDITHIRNNPRIDKIIQVKRLNFPWWDERFEINQEDADYIKKEIDVVVSCEATDDDYHEMPHCPTNVENHLEIAGFDSSYSFNKRCDLTDQNLNVSRQFLFDNHLTEDQYIAFHPFSSQSGRRLMETTTSEILQKSRKTLPIILLGTQDECCRISLNDHFSAGGQPFFSTLGLIKLAKFGVYVNSCLMTAAQAMNAPSIILQPHDFSTLVNGPYIKKTKHITGTRALGSNAIEVDTIVKALEEGI